MSLVVLFIIEKKKTLETTQIQQKKNGEINRDRSIPHDTA